MGLSLPDQWLLGIARAGAALTVVAGTSPSNVASQRVLLACGFSEIGRSATDVRFRLVLRGQAAED